MPSHSNVVALFPLLRAQRVVQNRIRLPRSRQKDVSWGLLLGNARGSRWRFFLFWIFFRRRTTTAVQKSKNKKFSSFFPPFFSPLSSERRGELSASWKRARVQNKNECATGSTGAAGLTGSTGATTQTESKRAAQTESKRAAQAESNVSTSRVKRAAQAESNVQHKPSQTCSEREKNFAFLATSQNASTNSFLFNCDKEL